MKNTSHTILKVDKKITSRIVVIASQVISKLSIPAFNLIISLVIVKLFSKDLWGQFVYLSLVANILTMIIAWGSTDLLLKQFASKPAQVFQIWSKNILSRSILVIIIIPASILLSASAGVKWLFPFFVFSLVAYKSFEVLISFFRRFILALVLEISGFAFTILAIWWYPNITITELLLIFTVANLLKTIPLLFIFVLNKPIQFSLDLRILRESVPFFLPSLIGLVQSRVDIYVIAALLTRKELATYQIFLSLLSMVHQIALMTISPYVKNIYRLSDAMIRRLARKFFAFGIIVTFCAIPSIYLVQFYFYGIDLDELDYVLGLLILLPLFYYSIRTYEWFKNGKQYQVAYVNAVMVCVGLALALILIPPFGITGGLCASAVSQWLAFSIFAIKK